MRAVMTSAVSRFAPVAPRQVRGAQVAGLAIASVVPAVIWSLLISETASWIGAPLAVRTVLFTAAAIALFLGAVCSPIILRDEA
jgi:hypothetical protein